MPLFGVGLPGRAAIPLHATRSVPVHTMFVSAPQLDRTRKNVRTWEGQLRLSGRHAKLRRGDIGSASTDDGFDHSHHQSPK
jgi:hypothetical protein